MRSASERALRDALHHFTLLVEHAAGGLDRQIVIDAVCMRLSAGVERLVRMDELPIMVGTIEVALRA